MGNQLVTPAKAFPTAQSCSPAVSLNGLLTLTRASRSMTWSDQTLSGGRNRRVEA
jgi:hypothetical protein